MPRETDQQRQLGEPVADGGTLRRGDLLFSGNHVALAVDEARVIHVSFAARAVKVEPVAAARDGDLPLTVRRLHRA
jgi:cell wall-associated NlpC family hydrolase